MPFLSIVTNGQVLPESRDLLLKAASSIVAAGTGKPERYVLVKIEDRRPLLFATSDEPAAFLEVKSIGFPGAGVKELTRTLCDLVTEHLGVPGEPDLHRL